MSKHHSTRYTCDYCKKIVIVEFWDNRLESEFVGDWIKIVMYNDPYVNHDFCGKACAINYLQDGEFPIKMIRIPYTSG